MAHNDRDLTFVSAGLGLDGGGRALAGRLLLSACMAFARERGIEMRVLTLEGGGLPDADVPVRSFGGDQKALAMEVWKSQLAGRRSAYVFDLLGPARVQAYLPGALRSPYLLPLYGIEVWRPLEWDRRRAIARATAVFSISTHTVERARPFLPRRGDLPVVPLALEERRPEGAVDAGLISRLDRGFLLIVGRMSMTERYKGHDQILEAMTTLPDARLVVAGDGDDRRRLEGKATALGLGDRTFFTGFLSEATLAELYRRCAAFVMPSRGEGFGLVYLEAMRAGKPVLAACGSAAEEIVQDEKTGLLVNPDDRDELRTALDRLVSHPGEVRRMGESGRERWRKEFGLERFQERLRPLIERLVS